MIKKIKIAFVPSTFLPIIGGAEIQTHNLANLIAFKGHTVDIWNTKKCFYKKKYYKLLNFNNIILMPTYLLRYYFKIKFNFILKLYLKSIIKSKKYHIWHFHSLNYKTLIISELLKELNQKVVFTFQGIDIQIDKKISYGYRLDSKYDILLKKNLKQIDKVYSISKEIDKNLFKLGFPKEKILRIPNCVFFKKINKFRKNKEKKLILITVARLATKKKGYDFVIKIARELKKKVNFRWIIIGKNVDYLSYNKFISNNKKNFELVGEIGNNELFFPHSKLIKYYKSSSIYLHLSRIESFGITVLEAIASGLPVIAFKSVGSNTLIKDKINGFLVNCYDTKEYAKKIVHVYKNKINFSKNSKYIKKYNLEKNCNKVLVDYNKIIAS